MRKPITFAIVFIIAFTSAITGQPLNKAASNTKAKSKQVELLEGTEGAKAIARLGDLSRLVLRERLKQMRQPYSQPSPLHVSEIIEEQHLSIASCKSVDRLKVVLQPVLDYHGRSLMSIYVLWSDQPKAYSVDRTAIFITTGLLIHASDEELRGIVAHELAHEYVWDERKNARQMKDVRLMRECELFCDAVAAFTLKEIGDDPVSYGRILERVTGIEIKAGIGSRYESDTHPSLETRKKLNKFLCQQLD